MHRDADNSSTESGSKREVSTVELHTQAFFIMSSFRSVIRAKRLESQNWRIIQG
jgi:hypothetical protein